MRRLRARRRPADVEDVAQQISLIAAFTAGEPHIESEKKITKRVLSRYGAQEARLIPSGSVLEDVEKDNDVRVLIHNMMELMKGTTIMNIVVECQKSSKKSISV